MGVSFNCFFSIPFLFTYFSLPSTNGPSTQSSSPHSSLLSSRVRVTHTTFFSFFSSSSQLLWLLVRFSLAQLHTLKNQQPEIAPMQAQEYTFDAAYKLTLWMSLMEAHHEWRQEEAQAKGEFLEHPLPLSVQMCLWDALPLRQSRSCCQTGLCGGTSKKVHRFLNISRSEVRVMHGIRDDACMCLATSCACLQPPVTLHIREYHSIVSQDGRFDGLRALLARLHCERIAFWEIASSQDSVQVSLEIARAARREMYRRTSWTSLALGGMPLIDAPTLCRALQESDFLTDVSLEDCGLVSVDDVAAYVQSSQVLQRISLRGNKKIASWTAFGAAVGSNAHVSRIDMSMCRVSSSALSQILSFGGEFAARLSFSLDLSNNVLVAADLDTLATSDEAFRVCTVELRISGQRMTNCGVAAANLLGALPALKSFHADRCELSSNDMQRITRIWGRAQHGTGEALSFSGNKLSVRDAKYVFASITGSDASVCVSDNELDSKSITKIGLNVCMGRLHTLDLSSCDLGDAGLIYLAGVLEKSAPLPLVSLILDSNVASSSKVGKHGFQFLARALRQQYAPSLLSLSLAHNSISIKSLTTLIEQVSPTLALLNLSHSSVTTDEEELLKVVHCIIARQKSGSPFEKLDVNATSSAAFVFKERGSAWQWLRTQTAVVIALDEH